MESLHELIETRRPELLERWERAVRRALTAEGMPEPALLDSMPFFLLELAQALREKRNQPSERLGEKARSTARSHGAQRLSLGFSIEAVAREYAFLRETIFALAKESGLRPDWAELDACARHLEDATIEALREYQHHRDDEQRKQASDHVSFLAHELRNPLTSARMALALLRPGPLASAGKPAQVLERNLATLGELIDTALIQSRLRAGMLLDRDQLDVEELVRDAIGESIIDVETKSLVVRMDVEAGLTLSADRRLLRSVITNLLRNAVRFSRSGGDVSVRAQRIEDKVRLWVEDSCGGLEPASLAKLFDPFVQVGADRSGFGLGLAIARQATEAHGGEIQVQTLPGKGCVFLIDLPADGVRRPSP